MRGGFCIVHGDNYRYGLVGVCMLLDGWGGGGSSLEGSTTVKVAFTCFACCLVQFLLESHSALMLAFLSSIILLCSLKTVQLGFAALWPSSLQFGHQKALLPMCFTSIRGKHT